MTQSAEDFIRQLADQARACGEEKLATYLSENLAAVAAIYRANPRQADAATADKDNPFQYTMR